MAGGSKQIMTFFNARVDFNKKSEPVLKFIKQFFTDNIAAISGDGFTVRIVFGDIKRKELLAIYDVNIAEWNELVDSHEILQIGENVKDILNQLLIIHYIKTKNPAFLKFLAIKLFTSKYYKAFPNYMVEARMKAVYNSLSNKFYIKKYGTLDKSLDATINTYLSTYSNRFAKATDDDLIYIINQLSTRVNIFVRNVQDKYYNSPEIGAMFEDKEVLDRENKRETTNDTVRYDGIISRVRNQELTYSYDLNTLKQMKGYEYKDTLNKMYREDKAVIGDIIREVMYDYIRSNNAPSLKQAHDNFVIWSFKNKHRSEELNRLLNGLMKKHNVESAENLKEVMVRYYSFRLYRELLKESV